MKLIDKLLSPASPDAASTEISSLRAPGGGRNRSPRMRAPHLRAPGLWRLASWARAHEASALLVALLVAIALTPHVLNFARRDSFERDIVPGALGWQALEATEGRLLDARFVARGAITPRSARDIAIVAIDQASLEGMGEWPWPRAWHAQLIRKLKQAGARAIVFDVNFSSKQSPLPNGELSAGDRALVEASEAAGNVLISTGFHAQSRGFHSGNAGQDTRGRVNSTTPPFDELDATTADVGFNWLPPDSFNQTRRYAWRARISGAPLASLAALSVGMLAGKLDGDENKSFLQVLERNSWPDASGTMRRVPLSEVRVGRDDRAWTTPIFFWGPPGTFETHSYQDVLRGSSGQWSPAALRQKFGGRIVFVGGTADILKDLVGAPAFVSQHDGQASAAQIAGVELHAGMAAQMLDGRYLHPQSAASTWGALLAMCLGSTAWMSLMRAPVSRAARRAQGAWSRARAPGRVHALVWFALYGGLGALPIAGFWMWAQWQLAARDTWIVAVYPMLGAILSSSGALLLFFVAESGQRRKAMAVLGRQVSPDVMEEMLASPDGLQQKPERRQATVLFSDLEGFTSYSESHSAEEVGAALDEYMTRMVAVVHGHGGALDKFIGDAVMAFFGAPLPRFDHAAQGLACAVAMQEECARFRRETGIPFFMRVGVHSGEVIAGEMGARERANYTVIGDTVNLASRLEAKNKELGSRILCSHETFAMAPDVIDAEPARVSVKGLARPVDAWIVHGMRALPPIEDWQPIAPADQPAEMGAAEQEGASSEAPTTLQEDVLLPALPAAPNPNQSNEAPPKAAST